MRKQSNYKLPEELIAVLQERAAAERVTATDLVTMALEQFLGVNVTLQKEGTRIVVSITDLVTEIEAIKKTLEEIPSIKKRLDEIENGKPTHFMSNSSWCGTSASNISINGTPNDENDGVKDNNLLADKVKQIEEENENLRQRVKALEALIPEYNCQEYVRDNQ